MSLKASAYRNYSITVALFQPLVTGGDYIRTLDNELSSYSHTISSIGGFTSASISINISPSEISDWITNGLGRHIVAYGSGGEIIWEGFVDNISINIGNDTIERGRLTEICNRCMITYTPVTTSDTDQKVSGTTTNTLVEDNETSKEKYGIWEQVVAGGSIVGVGDTIDEQILDIYAKARYMRDLYLEENREPETNHNPIVGVDSGGDITMTLDCKGYIEWLNYIYNYASQYDGDVQIEVSDKIALIIASDPNDIISRIVTNLNFNGMIIGKTEEDDRKAKTIIEEAVSIGDINSLPWIFGIYEDRVPFYNPVSTTIDYMYYVTSQMQKLVSYENGSEIMPWNARPGKLLLLPDTVSSGFPQADARTDPRTMSIEEINFTAPDTLNISGKKIRKFDQLLASQGLA